MAIGELVLYYLLDANRTAIQCRNSMMDWKLLVDNKWCLEVKVGVGIRTPVHSYNLVRAFPVWWFKVQCCFFLILTLYIVLSSLQRPFLRWTEHREDWRYFQSKLNSATSSKELLLVTKRKQRPKTKRLATPIKGGAQLSTHPNQVIWIF